MSGKNSTNLRKKIAIASAVVLALMLVVVAVQKKPFSISKAPVEAPKTTVKESASDKTTPLPANESTKAATLNSSNATPTTTNTSAASGYTYTAQTGDSFTLFARDAIDKYTTANNINPASYDQLLTEVDLTNTAGSPLLEVGQTVTLKQEDIVRAISANKTTSADPTKPTAAKPSVSDAGYTYTVHTGDTYTELARTAIDSYLKDQKASLNAMQRMAAESFAVTAAQQPLVETGQTITIAKSAVKSAVESAQKLSREEQNNWQQYAQLAVL